MNAPRVIVRVNVQRVRKARTLISGISILTALWKKLSIRDLHDGSKELRPMNSIRGCTRWIVPLSRDLLVRRPEIKGQNWGRWRRMAGKVGGNGGRWISSSNGIGSRNLGVLLIGSVSA